MRQGSLRLPEEDCALVRAGLISNVADRAHRDVLGSGAVVDALAVAKPEYHHTATLGEKSITQYTA